MIERNPRKPAEPSDTATTLSNPATAAATPEPIKAQKNGKRYFKLTPNKAGSVIPRRADTPADEARPFVLEFFVKNQMANVAAPWATLAIEATTKTKSPYPIPSRQAESNCVSIAGKDWCRPVITINE